MGMSQGGFLSYKLACELDKTLTAIAVVTGGMTDFMQIGCSVPDQLAVVHFHGTNDQVVNYYGSFGIPPVEETVAWWAVANNCDDTPVITELPDINMSDSSTVEQHYYPNCKNETETILYKVINGGHTWPGAFPIQTLGVTNQDINASQIIGDFFETHCVNTTSVASGISPLIISVYPNPANDFLTIDFADKHAEVMIHNAFGQPMKTPQYFHNQTTIDCLDYPVGIYVVSIRQNNIDVYRQLFVVSH